MTAKRTVKRNSKGEWIPTPSYELQDPVDYIDGLPIVERLARKIQTKIKNFFAKVNRTLLK